VKKDNTLDSYQTSSAINAALVMIIIIIVVVIVVVIVIVRAFIVHPLQLRVVSKHRKPN